DEKRSNTLSKLLSEINNVLHKSVRERIKNALYDFHIIAQNLPLADIQQLFEPAYDWSRERR
ncbi:hypothetical protein ACFQMK_12000, partial [Halorubrum yunnanense]